MNKAFTNYQSLDPRTPVLVGIAARTEHGDDPLAMSNATEAMHAVAQNAMRDAGCSAECIDSISVPQGLWTESNAPGLLKSTLGAHRAQTVLMQIGVLQQSAFTQAACAIAKGEIQVALIVGAEARQRERLATKMAIALPEVQRPKDVPQVPDHILSPAQEVSNSIEAERGLLFPVSAYAMIENAFCHKHSLKPSIAHAEIDNLWASMSNVAEHNSDSWAPRKMSPESIRQQPKMANPYTRAHVSQWNVNQSAALIMCSLEMARTMRGTSQHWIFPWSSAESNHMQTLSERADLHSCLGLDEAVRGVLDIAQLSALDIDYWDLYSCFPIAVRLQLAALNLSKPIIPTVTGGMSFAGGPLNNYSLQSTVKMAQLLRAKGGLGVISSVSGILHKFGIGVWGGVPPTAMPYQHMEVQHNQAITKNAKTLLNHFSGTGSIASHTINYRDGNTSKLIAIIDIPKTNHRAIAISEDTQLIAMAERDYLIGMPTVVKDNVLVSV